MRYAIRHRRTRMNEPGMHLKIAIVHDWPRVPRGAMRMPARRHASRLGAACHRESVVSLQANRRHRARAFELPTVPNRSFGTLPRIASLPISRSRAPFSTDGDAASRNEAPGHDACAPAREAPDSLQSGGLMAADSGRRPAARGRHRRRGGYDDVTAGRRAGVRRAPAALRNKWDYSAGGTVFGRFTRFRRKSRAMNAAKYAEK